MAFSPMNVHQRKIALFVELLIFIFPPLMLIDGICSLGVRALCARVANVAISIVGLWGLLLGLLKIGVFPFPNPVAPSPLANLRVFWVKTSKREGGSWGAGRPGGGCGLEEPNPSKSPLGSIHLPPMHRQINGVQQVLFPKK